VNIYMINYDIIFISQIPIKTIHQETKR